MIAAVVEDGGRYLVGRRPAHKRHGGLWEFPGGKIHPGEGDEDAARRELDEELGLEVTGIGARLLSVADPGSRFVIEFVEVRTRGVPAPTEHEEIGWFRPSELRDLELAPADRRFADLLADAYGGHPEPGVDHGIGGQQDAAERSTPEEARGIE